MKWEPVGNKQGFIFDAMEYGLNFAKSPQAVVFDSFVRIYFSYCITDERQKYISTVGYVDMDKSFEKVLDISKNVLSRGKLGCFDEHGIFPFSPLVTSDHYYGYTSGWSRRLSVSTDSGIGLVESFDQGKTFHRLGDGPVLCSSLEEPFLVIDGFVRVYHNLFHMWYIYGTEWKKFEDQKEPDRIYKIGHAVSKDGIEWERMHKQIIEDKLPLECQALPTVVQYKDRYHMFFCYRNAVDFRTNRTNSYRIGYAYSDDLKEWKRDDMLSGMTLSENGWDSQMQCYPNVFEMDHQLYMLYNGNQFGKYGFGLVRLKEE